MRQSWIKVGLLNVRLAKEKKATWLLINNDQWADFVLKHWQVHNQSTVWTHNMKRVSLSYAINHLITQTPFILKLFKTATFHKEAYLKFLWRVFLCCIFTYIY